MRLSIFLLFALLVTVGSVLGLAHDGEGEEPTLLVYSTVTQLLGGDVTEGKLIPEVEEYLEHFAPEWAVMGVGTTTQPMRNGELMPDGTAERVHYWWVDPSSEGQNRVVDLADAPEAAGTTPADGESAASAIDFEPEFPFVALAIADPEEALTYEVEDVDNLHDWIIATLAETDATLAGLHVTGDFGAISTTVGYNLPMVGIDSAGAYMNADSFHFIDYDQPATWTMNGFYTSDPDLQPVVSTEGRPVHLHGYQPGAMIGGHITSAVVESATVMVYPLEQVIQTRADETEAE